MMRPRSFSSREPSTEWRWRSLLWAQFVGLAISMTLCWHSFDEVLQAEKPVGFVVATWRLFQAFLPLAVLFTVGNVLRCERWACAMMTGWWYWIMVDLIVHQWTGMHVASVDVLRLLYEKSLSLLPYVHLGMVIRFGIGFATLLLLTQVGRIATRRIARRCSDARNSLSSLGASLAWLGAIALLAAPAWMFWATVQSEMRAAPSRHALSVIGWPASKRSDRPTLLAKESTSLKLTNASIRRRTQAFRLNVATNEPEQRPDILFIVVESLRPELIDSDVMPNVNAAAENGLWMQRHFSGGNASSLGLFSLFNGLDAIWFYRSDVRYAPAMNRLFHQSGYECGFFGAANDWAAFQMDAFVRKDVYDAFEVSSYDGLRSDRRAIQASEEFLADHADRRPRLAVLYLYATHAPFEINPLLQQDQPAASRNYSIPFGPANRESIWNRYRNSARTVDHLIAPLLKHPDRIVAIVGDHGESFLDDGTIGHGTRLSASQTQTPAIIVGRNVPTKKVREATSHADLLPTLLELCDIQTSRPMSFDGRDVSNPIFRPRVIAIADYLREQAILIPNEADLDPTFFGLQVEISLLKPHFQIIGTRSRQGNPRQFSHEELIMHRQIARKYLDQTFPD